jgi:hypothetical protein
MVERRVRQALRKLGTRAEALGTCPVCGQPVSPGAGAVRAWSGKWAHRDCASYRPRSPRKRGLSQRVYSRFTPA